jgi:hypothetical protein
MVLRQTAGQIRYWRPWQQALLASSLIVLGVALVVLAGDRIGVPLAVGGILLIGQTVRNLRHARHAHMSRGVRASDRAAAPGRNTRPPT